MACMKNPGALAGARGEDFESYRRPFEYRKTVANTIDFTAVNRAAPDSDYNRSIMQRMAHLIHDANGVRFCNKDHAKISVAGLFSFGDFPECGMFQIDDLALFYVLTMADHGYVQSTKATRYDTTYSKASFREAITSAPLKLVLPDSSFSDGLLQGPLMTDIPGFTRFPTPQAASRSLFIDQAHASDFLKKTIDPVRCSDGDRFIDVHNDSIFAWEKAIPNNPSPFPNDSFYQAVLPVITAFAKHDECVGRDGSGACMRKQNAAKIFVDLMSLLHVHWGSAKSTYFGHSYQSNNPFGTRTVSVPASSVTNIVGLNQV